MTDLISKLTDIRSEYNCFDESEEPYYRALSETIKILLQRADGDSISRQAAIDVTWEEPTYTDTLNVLTEVRDKIRALPSAQPEITDVQAIEHLQKSGWMKNHDKQMYEMGLRKQLADDSDSYDALLPSAKSNLQPTCNQLATDCISRQATIDALHTQFRDGFDGDKWWNSTHVLAAIEGVPSAGSRWIPVTERLPEDGTEVWVTTDMLFEVTRARWHKDTNLWCHPYNSDCLLVLRPIAWMEISFPEPYKGGVESHYCPNCGAEMQKGEA